MAQSEFISNAKQAIRNKDRQLALQWLSKELKSNTNSVEAWVLMGRLLENPEKKLIA